MSTFRSSSNPSWFAEQHGLCRSLSYIIQTLSTEKAFAAKLNAPIMVQIPPKWHEPGTAADFLINVRLFAFDLELRLNFSSQFTRWWQQRREHLTPSIPL
jgi:hypothetical protein